MASVVDAQKDRNMIMVIAPAFLFAHQTPSLSRAHKHVNVMKVITFSMENVFNVHPEKYSIQTGVSAILLVGKMHNLMENNAFAASDTI